MAKVGEFYITTVRGPAWEKDRYAVREKIGIGPGEWRRIASTQSHFQAQRIIKTLTEATKSNLLYGIDVGQEMEDIYKERVASEVATFFEDAADQPPLPSSQRYPSTKGRKITTRGSDGRVICTHVGGSEPLTITIE